MTHISYRAIQPNMINHSRFHMIQYNLIWTKKKDNCFVYFIIFILIICNIKFILIFFYLFRLKICQVKVNVHSSKDNASSISRSRSRAKMKTHATYYTRLSTRYSTLIESKPITPL